MRGERGTPRLPIRPRRTRHVARFAVGWSLGVLMATEVEMTVIGPVARYEQNVLRRIRDFEDPRQEWRRLFSEVLGTFFLVLVAAGGGMMGQAFPGLISHSAAAVAPA